MIPNVISVSQIHFYNIVLHASGTVSEASMVPEREKPRHNRLWHIILLKEVKGKE